MRRYGRRYEAIWAEIWGAISGDMGGDKKLYLAIVNDKQRYTCGVLIAVHHTPTRHTPTHHTPTHHTPTHHTPHHALYTPRLVSAVIACQALCYDAVFHISFEAFICSLYSNSHTPHTPHTPYTIHTPHTHTPY